MANVGSIFRKVTKKKHNNLHSSNDQVSCLQQKIASEGTNQSNKGQDNYGTGPPISIMRDRNE